MAVKTFGKRASAAPASGRRAPAVAVPDTAREPVQPDAAPAVEPKPVVTAVVAPVPELSDDEELRRWTEERQRTLFYRLPWKQFSLIASLSFGIASFVLPDDVNDSVDYLLWGLSLISFAVWISGFFNKKPDVPYRR
jgi:hypothetical protein